MKIVVNDPDTFSLQPFLWRMSCIITLSTALISAQPGLMGSGERNVIEATPVHTITKPPAAYLPAMDLPLATWVGTGDAIRIKAFPDTGSFITGTYIIMDSGFVNLPILGLVKVTRMSNSTLTAHLTNGYAKYLAYPTIQIEPLIHLSLLGGFLNPGMYLVNPTHPFSSVLSAAGGTIRDDGLKLLRWERNGNVLAENLTKEVEGTTSLWALGFKSGDQICITLRTKSDILPIAGFIVSTIVASATLAMTILVLQR